MIVANNGINIAKLGTPPMIDCINAGRIPEAVVDAAVAGKKLNVPVIMVCATPAAMNNPTPLPNPHLDTTSSRYKIKIAPITNWRIIIP